MTVAPTRLASLYTGAGGSRRCKSIRAGRASVVSSSVAPYWVMYRLLDVQRLGKVSSAGYDRAVVPLGRALEAIVPRPPRGKNLVAIARRPSQ